MFSGEAFPSEERHRDGPFVLTSKTSLWCCPSRAKAPALAPTCLFPVAPCGKPVCSLCTLHMNNPSSLAGEFGPYFKLLQFHISQQYFPTLTSFIQQCLSSPRITENQGTTLNFVPFFLSLFFLPSLKTPSAFVDHAILAPSVYLRRTF